MENLMSIKSVSKCVFKVALFCLFVGALLISSPTEKVAADVPYSCSHLLSGCIYSCAATHGNDPEQYQICRAQCEMNLNYCNACDATGLPIGCEGGIDIPEPWPVFFDFTHCMDTCAETCLTLENLADRWPCYVPCKANCIATYAN